MKILCTKDVLACSSQTLKVGLIRSGLGFRVRAVPYLRRSVPVQSREVCIGKHWIMLRSQGDCEVTQYRDGTTSSHTSLITDRTDDSDI